MKFNGNTILITGGASGIGRALAEAFQALGNTVVIAGRRREALDETVAANPGMHSMILDIADAGAIETFAAELAQKHPETNVLVNNAGIMRAEDLLSGEKHLADSEAIVATNLLGPIRLTAALLPMLQRHAQSTIVNTTSGLAFVPMALTPTYCATKAAMHSYTQSLRLQLRNTKTEVIELIPPYVATDLMGGASDPTAMPLKDFIAETMSLFKSRPTPEEICVDRVKPLRYAAESKRYEDVYDGINSRITATSH